MLLYFQNVARDVARNISGVGTQCNFEVERVMVCAKSHLVSRHLDYKSLK